MLPSKEDWETIVSNLGINNSDHVIVYDNSDVLVRVEFGIPFYILGIIQILFQYQMEVLKNGK